MEHETLHEEKSEEERSRRSSESGDVRARSAGTISTSLTAALLLKYDPRQVSPRERDLDTQEAVVERSPKGRFARFNKLLGKGAYKTVTQPFSTP